MVNSATFAPENGRRSIHARPIEAAVNRHVPLIAVAGATGTGITGSGAPAWAIQSRGGRKASAEYKMLPVIGSGSATGPIADAAQVSAVSSARNSSAPGPGPTALAYGTAQYLADGR